MMRALIASLLVTTAVAVVPAGAPAQDAGGHQYDDPLAGTPSTPSTPTAPSSGTTASSGSTGTTSPSTGTVAPSTASTAATTPTATATGTGAGQIPRTGFPVGWLTFAGFLALGGGFALRRAAGFQAA
jgi:hypothetical protein